MYPAYSDDYCDECGGLTEPAVRRGVEGEPCTCSTWRIAGSAIRLGLGAIGFVAIAYGSKILLIDRLF